LHQLIAGKVPFVAANTMVLLEHHLERPRPQLVASTWRKAPVDRLLDRMMAKRPEERFESYDELIAALDRVSPRRRVRMSVRAAAFLLDWILVASIVQFILRAGDPNATNDSLAAHVAIVVAFVMYVTFAHARFGRTLAQQGLGLEVVSSGGGRPPLARAALRSLVLMSNGLVGTAAQIAGVTNTRSLDVIFYGVTLALVLASLLDPQNLTPWDRASRTRVRWSRGE